MQKSRLFLFRVHWNAFRAFPLWMMVALMALLVPLSALAISKKKQKREAIMKIKPDVERLMRLAEEPLKLPPAIVATDQAAYDYCGGMAWRSEEDYARDTATVNAWLDEMKWVDRHLISIPVEDWKYFPGYNQEKLNMLYSYAFGALAEMSPRYAVLCNYCNGVLKDQQEARARQMPEGKVLTLDYEESGGSRPVSVFYKLFRDSVSGRVVLQGHDFESRSSEPLEVSLDETVMDSVRIIIEKHKIYKELRYYSLPPSFPNAPLPCGGPPAWYFRCHLEGGTVKTGSDGVSLSSGCSEVAHYLSSLLQAWEKKQNLR